MSLPRQVAEQLKEVEEIEKQLNADKTQVVEPVAAEPEPKTEIPAEPKPAEPVTEPPVVEEDWQQKYRTLKGMYDAEVPRLHVQLKELRADLQKLQAAPPPKAEPKPTEKLVTDEDVDAFGAELIEVQRKVAREVANEFRAELDVLKEENNNLKQRVETTSSQVSTASFEQRLQRAVPSFETINADPRWIAWLEEVDPILRGPRKNVAQHAFNQGDVDAIADYVGLFEASLGPQTDKKADKNAELERQVQPKRNASNNAPTAKDRIYTNAEISTMFAKAAALSSRGQHDKALELEAEIDAAFTAGRVTA
jgi:hypothetical protein